MEKARRAELLDAELATYILTELYRIKDEGAVSGYGHFPVRVDMFSFVNRCARKFNDRYQGMLGRGVSFREYSKEMIEIIALGFFNGDKNGVIDYLI
jgi:hypothetical protein